MHLDPRPTWKLIREAAETMAAQGRSLFTRAEVVAEVQRVDPTRSRSSIDPIIQGMTANARGGPMSACGEVFVRVDRGRYRLLAAEQEGTTPPTATRPVPQPGTVPPTMRTIERPTVWAAGPGGRRIGLVGCVKEKAQQPCAAKDLYTSTLFVGRRAFVEASCSEWWILSAKHGLVRPDQALAPYDAALKDASRSARRAWSRSVLAAIEHEAAPLPGDTFEVHAGAEYRDYGLVEGILALGCVVENPTLGLVIGRQLAFYAGSR